MVPQTTVNNVLFINKMKSIHSNLLCFLDSNDNIEENFEVLTDTLKDQKIGNSKQETKFVLMLLLRIVNNHHRCLDFYDKIKVILQHFQKEIINFFSNSEIFDIFKSDKRILLYLIESKILVFDDFVCKQIITDEFIMAKYHLYFLPELKKFINKEWFPHNAPWIHEINNELQEDFFEKRKIGENDSIICELIRKDLIDEFCYYIESNEIDLDQKINLSIYETNSFLIRNSISNEIDLIHYSAFYGSKHIFLFLKNKGIELDSTLWLYAIHGNNLNIIQVLKSNLIIPQDETYTKCLIEAIECHHNEIIVYIQKEILKKKEISHDILVQTRKFYNFSFINSKTGINDLLNIEKNLDEQVSSSQTNAKRKRGRPPKPKNEDQNIDKNQKPAKKIIDNTQKTKQLDNPQLSSAKSTKSFFIPVLFRSNLNHDKLEMLYSQENKKEFDWKTIDIEQIFRGESKDEESIKNRNNEIKDQITEEYQEEEEEYEDESIEEVTRENLESEYAPFPDVFTAYTFISKANKGYRLGKVDSKNNDTIAYECKAKGCFYRIECTKLGDGYHVSHQSHHTCSNPIIISTAKIEAVIKSLEKQEHLNNEYYNKIHTVLGLPPDSICKLRIRRAYNKVYMIRRKDRLCTWGMLQAFIDIIKRYGGKGDIHKNEEGCIDFVGIVPNYAIKFLTSSLFFPVIQMDSRFQTGISRGRMYVIVTYTGNRTILPLAISWAASESKIYTNLLLNMLNTELHFIRNCITDEAFALISSLEKVEIANSLCCWHLSKHCPCKNTFKDLVKCQTSHEYAMKKKDIIDNHRSLKDYLDQKSRWQKISRFESDIPRDQNTTSSAAESLNALIVKLHLKNKEPLEVMLKIYDFGFAVLKDICYQCGILTDSARDWLSYAMVVANNLTVTRSPILKCKYVVTKENDDATKCTVTICSSEKPTCTCMFFNDTGMPCVHMLSVACHFNINWSCWIHARYFVSGYRYLFQQDLLYPDFDQIIKTNDDVPVGISSLKQKQRRIPTPGDISSKH